MDASLDAKGYLRIPKHITLIWLTLFVVFIFRESNGNACLFDDKGKVIFTSRMNKIRYSNWYQNWGPELDDRQHLAKAAFYDESDNRIQLPYKAQLYIKVREMPDQSLYNGPYQPMAGHRSIPMSNTIDAPARWHGDSPYPRQPRKSRGDNQPNGTGFHSKKRASTNTYDNVGNFTLK